MAKGYWKAVLAVAFFIVAGVCYGGSLFQEGSIVLEGETEAGGAGCRRRTGQKEAAHGPVKGRQPWDPWSRSRSKYRNRKRPGRG